ncbi:metallopeptidase MepB [Flammula alnicola]|nr:metallopeptidase MepB [Flammula alnicola]
MAFTPPQPPMKWDHSEQNIAELTKQAIEKYGAVLDTVGQLDPRDCNFDSLALAQAKTAFYAQAEPLGFYRNVSASKELCDASTESESLVREFGVESSMRVDVFKSKAAAEKNIKESGQWEKLSSEEQRLVEKMILDGTRAGLALPAEKQEELKILKKELSQVCLESQKNLNEENGHITFTEEELKGVQNVVLSGYTKRTEEGQNVYDVTFKGLDIFPITEHAENPETRKRAQEGYESRSAINTPVLAKALELRRKIASLLGYKTWADYVTEVKMVKSGKGVEDFLNGVEEKLLPIGIKDREKLLAMKKKEHEDKGLPFDNKLYTWDFGYYNTKYVKETLDLDGTLIKEYFPVSVVVPTILEIYQNLLAVRFEEMKDASVWHPEVQVFAVWEKDPKHESGFVGYCYLDLLPRPGKHNQTSVWPILPGYDLPTGKRSYPVSAMVANLATPTSERPALMRHHDVVMFFHEMGHIFHDLLSKTKFARFHGTSVALDFGEAPSQMLENWCWEPRILQQISSHYETKEPLSPELIEKLLKSRYVNVGLFNLQQLFFAKFDLIIHTEQTAEDYTHLWCSLREKISLRSHDKECPAQSAFGHLTGGYDVGYYGYTYSLVFAADMYATVFKADPLDPVRGRLYRDKILCAGSSRDDRYSHDCAQEFLGRPPNSEAFLRELLGTVVLG